MVRVLRGANPLGHKQAPLATVAPDDPDFQALTADDPSLREDPRIIELAALAVEAIGLRIEAGEDARAVVVEVVEKRRPAAAPGQVANSGDGICRTQPYANPRTTNRR